MEDSDDSNHEDVWSPTLREDVFSNHDMMGHSWNSEPRNHVEHLPLPNFNPTFNPIRSQPLNNLHWSNSLPHQQQQQQRQQQRGQSNTTLAKSSSSSSSSSSRHPLSPASVIRNHSHLDLPNFPLQAVCISRVDSFCSELLVSFRPWSKTQRLSAPFR